MRWEKTSLTNAQVHCRSSHACGNISKFFQKENLKLEESTNIKTFNFIFYNLDLKLEESTNIKTFNFIFYNLDLI